MKNVSVALLQLPSSSRYQNNLDRLMEFISSHKDTKIIMAPEVFLTAYDYEHLSTAAKFSAKAIKEIKKIVDEQIVVLTLILKDKKSGEFVNRAVVIHNHKVVYKQDKYKLFKMGEEDRYLKKGKVKKIQPFEVDGLKLAILICFELRFKELWKQIEGVDIVLIPARWGLARKLHLEVLSCALAVMNQCFVLVCNSSDKDMASSSAIISPTGEVIQDDSKEFIEGNLNLREIKKMRRYIVMD